MNEKESKATAQIFQPLEDLYDLEALKKFGKHFQDRLPEKIGYQAQLEKVYGGRPLASLYDKITIEAKPLQKTATLTLHSRTNQQADDIVVKNVNISQFLVYALPDSEITLGESTKSLWSKMSDRNRFELCHSEIRRWSIIFLNDQPIGGADIIRKNHISKIEIVNNCTTVTGFEVKIIYAGRTYHGSFGAKEEWANPYTYLSNVQGGSLAHQEKQSLGHHDDYGHQYAKNQKSFFNIYYNYQDETKDHWKLTGKAALEGHPIGSAPPLDLNLYRSTDKSVLPHPLKETRGDKEKRVIDYKRLGELGTEYVSKPGPRRLVIEPKNKAPADVIPWPKTYGDVKNAEAISLPFFGSNGVYEVWKEFYFPKLKWLFETPAITITKLTDGSQELRLSWHDRDADSEYHLGAIVIGNLNFKKDIPIAGTRKAAMTFWRIGYAPRKTVMDYDSHWSPSSEGNRYAFLVGSKTKGRKPISKCADASDLRSDTTLVDRLMIPEAFGLERLILSWENSKKRTLVIDLISYERIIPVCQYRISFPKTLKFDPS